MDYSLLYTVLRRAEEMGCSFTDVRFQRRESELIQVDNKNLYSYSSDTFSGVGVRVVYGGRVGYASTSMLSEKNLMSTLEYAVKGARTQSPINYEPFGSVRSVNAETGLKMKINPADVAPEEKISLALDANKAAYVDDAIKSSYTRIGYVNNYTHFISSEGTEIKVKTPLIGLGHQSVASRNDVKEYVSDYRSQCSGWEFFDGKNWDTFTQELSDLALEALLAKPAPPGTFPVVVDQDVIGLVLHEALGHACEGDGVVSNVSILKGKTGLRIADEQVTVVDEGYVNGGYYHPYDDEGVEKGRTILINKGVLERFLTDRKTAKELGVESTGNGRMQDFENIPIPRQTNFYLSEGEYEFDELFEGIPLGLYIQGRGGRGGQVDPAGTFTFGVGPSRVIRNGEPRELVRGVVISGNIMETLSSLDAVGEEVKIKTGVFGGCGKSGQSVKVGMGGPPVRVQRMTVGGRN